MVTKSNPFNLVENTPHLLSLQPLMASRVLVEFHVQSPWECRLLQQISMKN